MLYFLGLGITLLTEYEQHETKSKYQISHLFKLLVAQFFNTAMIYYIVNFIIPTKIWDRNGIIMQVSSLVTTSAVIGVIMNIVNVSWVMSKLKNWWKFRKYQADRIPTFQDRLNKQYELPEFDIAGTYNYYIMNVWVVCFFSYIVPVGIPVLILVFCMQYFVDKFNLFKKSSVKSVYNFILARTAFKLFQSSIFWFAAGNLVFSIYFNNYSVTKTNIVTLVIASLYTLMVWCSPASWEIKLMRKYAQYEPSSYTLSRQSGKFLYTYKNQNPATKFFSNFYSTRVEKNKNR